MKRLWGEEERRYFIYPILTVWNAVGVLAALMTSRRNVHHCATYFLSDRAWLDSDKSFHRFIGRTTVVQYREPDARTAACRSHSLAFSRSSEIKIGQIVRSVSVSRRFAWQRREF